MGRWSSKRRTRTFATSSPSTRTSKTLSSTTKTRTSKLALEAPACSQTRLEARDRMGGFFCRARAHTGEVPPSPGRGVTMYTLKCAGAGCFSLQPSQENFTPPAAGTQGVPVRPTFKQPTHREEPGPIAAAVPAKSRGDDPIYSNVLELLSN